MIHEVSPHLDDIRSKTQEALNSLIEDPENTQLLEQFKFTFEQRSQKPWLSESAQGPLYEEQNGLSNALRNALSHHGEESQSRLIEQNLKDNMTSNLNPDFSTNLKDSVDEALLDNLGLERFIRSLERTHPQIETLSPKQLQEEVKHGFLVYWEQTYAHGYSGDPW